MYPFMALNDGTEIVHSDMLSDGRVKVYIERPGAKDGFHHVICWLPDGTWQDTEGFSDEDMAYFKELVRSVPTSYLSLPPTEGSRMPRVLVEVLKRPQRRLAGGVVLMVGPAGFEPATQGL